MKFEVTLFYHHSKISTRWIDGIGAKDVREKAIRRNKTWREKLTRQHYWIGLKRIK